MFSQTAEYALRAVACLARRPGEPMTTRQLALASRVPAGYLSKVLQALARAGVVSGQRGLNGGFVLARPAEELTLLDVVRVADGSRRITSCPMGLPQHGTGLCPLHRRLDEAAELAERTLGGVTVAAVLSEPSCPSGPEDGPACTGDGSGPRLPRSGRESHAAPATVPDPCAVDGTPRTFGEDRAGTDRLSPPCDCSLSGVPAKSA